MISFDDQTLATWVVSWLLPLFRILGIFGTAPIVSQRAVPVRLRVGLALAIAVLAAPVVPVTDLPLDNALLPVVVHEVLVGLMLGLLARIVFAAFEIAGEAIGLQMGLSFAGFFDPQSGAANPVSRLLNITAITAFVMLDGIGILIAAVIASYGTIPLGAGFGWIADRSPLMLGTEMFALALSIAMPFVVMLLFVNLALGIMSRVAPQFSVFSVGFPLTIGVGLAMLVFVMPLLETPLGNAMTMLARALG